MKIKILKDEGCVKNFAIVCAKDEMQPFHLEALKEIQENARIDGFRKGKVPEEYIEEYFKEELKRNTVEKIVSKAIDEIIREHDILRVIDSKVKKIQYDVNSGCECEIALEILPKIEVKNYKNIPVKKKKIAVSDEEVENVILSTREFNAKLVEDESGVVSENSCLVVDIKIVLKENISVSHEEKNVFVDLSLPGIIDAIKNNLVGCKRGEHKVLGLRLPKEYKDKRFANKDVFYEVDIKNVYKKILPEVEDKNFLSLFNAKDVDELKSNIRSMIEQKKAEDVRRDIENQIIEYLTKHNPAPLPPSLVEREAKRILEDTRKMYFSEGMSGEEWDKNLPTLYNECVKEAEKIVHLSVLLLNIAEYEHLEFDTEKVLQFLLEHVATTAS
jgi:trigger factor